MIKQCTKLFAHSLDKLETLEINDDFILKKCPRCKYVERLPHSKMNVLYPNNLVMQKKRWAHDDNAKEVLQPLGKDGSVNEEFTEAYGYNPFDERTKATTPRLQGGTAE